MTTLLTTDLLEVWTDPDTAMEAVGTTLGVFDEDGPSPPKVLAGDAELRDRLYLVLLNLVDAGALEMRPCGGGRHAFQWREPMSADAAGAVVTAAAKAPTETPAAPLPAPEPEPEPARVADPPPPPPVAAAPTPPAAIPLPNAPANADVPVVAQSSTPTADPKAPRPIAQAPLLVVPALSCLLAVLVYLWFDGAVAFAIGAVLVIAGVIGIIRRVPFAGSFTFGLAAAALLVRFS